MKTNTYIYRIAFVVLFCFTIIACDCREIGQPCEESSDCCEGTICVQFTENDISCAETCSSGADCDSGCCLALQEGDSDVCGDAAYCEGAGCQEAGESCETQDDCCEGTICAQFTENDISCAETCESSADCDSGCCLALQEGDGGVCGDAGYCEGAGCQGAGESCETQDDCCTGSLCVQLSETDIACAETCGSDSECTSDCCAPLQDSDDGVCVDGSYCGSGSDCAAPGDKCSPGDCCPGSTCVWIDYVGAICQVQTECPASCKVGSVCCRPPFCSGNCIGSPCC